MTCKPELWLGVIVIVGVLFVAMVKCARAEADEKQVRRDCRSDAVRFCTKEALRCIAKEDDICRAEVIACMQAHKAKLKPACARHLW